MVQLARDFSTRAEPSRSKLVLGGRAHRGVVVEHDGAWPKGKENTAWLRERERIINREGALLLLVTSGACLGRAYQGSNCCAAAFPRSAVVRA
jgi:hypothetical protein